MQDKTSLGISDTLRDFIESAVEEVVINGKTFDAQKYWLRKHSETEGLDYETLENNLNKLFDAIKELEEHESISTERFTRNLVQSCHLSETEAEKLIDYVASRRAQNETERIAEEEANRLAQEERRAEEERRLEEQRRLEEERRAEEARRAEEEAERNRQRLMEKNRIPVKIILILLGIISVLDIIFLGWWSVIPLLFNAYMGMLAHEKCRQGAFGYEKLVFKGGAMVVILFFASFLHWWSLLLIFPATYLIIGNDDIWDLN